MSGLGGAAAGIAVALCVGAGGATPAAERKPLPSFELRDLKGARFQSASLRGQVGVVSFWATWCAPCQQELTVIQTLLNTRPGVSLVAISTDGPETVAKIRSTVAQRRWTARILHDSAGSVGQKLNPKGAIPFTLFVDAEGRVAYVHAGYKSGDEAMYAQILDQLVGEAAPKGDAQP